MFQDCHTVEVRLGDVTSLVRNVAVGWPYGVTGWCSVRGSLGRYGLHQIVGCPVMICHQSWCWSDILIQLGLASMVAK